MTVHVEVWPVAADTQGLWLLSGRDAWRSEMPVAGDASIHAEVEYVLDRHHAFDDTFLLHSTSWRNDDIGMVTTYIAAVRCDDFVRDTWPTAEPISAQLPGAVGAPLTHAAVDPPTPRFVDVLMHALRHLSWLRGTDGTVAAELDETWRRHLAEFEPALARMYQEPHAA
jgi:hypothetical protein